jgi:hypothetical protein
MAVLVPVGKAWPVTTVKVPSAIRPERVLSASLTSVAWMSTCERLFRA